MSDLSFQVRAPLGLELEDGARISVTQWSLSGLECPETGADLPTEGTLSIPFQGVDIRFPVRFKPGDGARELLFDGLSGRQRETLAVFYRSILSGRMASTEEIITSLDTPVDLVPMEETTEEKEIGTRDHAPRFLRVIWSLLLYALIGSAVFGILGQQIWERLSRLTVGQAHVAAELIDHRAAVGAYVQQIRVAEGDRVSQGDVLVVLTAPGHSGALTAIRADIKRAERDLSKARRALALHLEGEEDARRVFEAALQRAINARRIADFLGDYDMWEIRRALRALAAFDAGLSQAEGDFHARRLFLAEILRERKDILAGHKRDLSAQKRVGGAADIIALKDGVITDLPVFKDQFLARGDIALRLEAAGPRHIVGWLDEDMAAAVYPGMTADMVANRAGRTRRFGGEVIEITALPNPNQNGQFGLRVLILPEPWAARDAPDLLRADAPVAVSLRRALPWVDRLREIF